MYILIYLLPSKDRSAIEITVDTLDHKLLLGFKVRPSFDFLSLEGHLLRFAFHSEYRNVLQLLLDVEFSASLDVQTTF